MALSLFDLFKIGIGPSSSHTVGPMWAANRFLLELESRNLLEACERLGTDLFGSLALTGKGHATDKAVILGLAGELPNQVDADQADALVEQVRASGRLPLHGVREIGFEEARDLVFRWGESLPGHPNGITFTARGADGAVLHANSYYSIGGGFVLSEQEMALPEKDRPGSNVQPRFDFVSAAQLLEIGQREQMTIAEIVLENEKAWREEAETRAGILDIWRVMEGCIQRGSTTGGCLPGGLKVKRRAKQILDELTGRKEATLDDPLTIMDWVNLFALAVNEENAAGGRIVTAPTNGAAGVIPAVLAYYMRFVPGAGEEGLVTFMATASAIGQLYKRNASISAAEVGCQGEVGVACSMAAGGLCAVLGGSNEQIENAAEIGMEHNLGLTCDPIGGLVQIPCIERNTMGAVKAINAARLALRGDGKHFVSLDTVIETMHQTGKDMSAKYKETSEGGLAVNVVAC